MDELVFSKTFTSPEVSHLLGWMATWLKESPDIEVRDILIYTEILSVGVIYYKNKSSSSRCGAYAKNWKDLGKPEGWGGCSLPLGHKGNHSDRQTQESAY